MHNPQNANRPRTGTSIGSVGIEVAPRRIILLRLISVFLSVTTAFAICSGQTKKRSSIQWNRSDCTSALMLPDGFYDLSQFGKGNTGLMEECPSDISTTSTSSFRQTVSAILRL